MIDIDRPQLEGSVAVGTDTARRRMGFAEFGSPHGRAVFWLHGTPGARRQIPVEARTVATETGIRLVGLDRPGVGSSTAHRYDSVRDFADDLRTVADTLGIDEFAVVGLSGGGPYALAAAHQMPERVKVVGVMGGVAPVVGPDRIGGGALEVAKHAAPLLEHAATPVGRVLSTAIRAARPVAEPIIGVYARLSPQGDRQLLTRPEFRAMFLDDLLNGGSRRMEAPLSDLIVFSRDWGFSVADIAVPVRWWHGDHDHIIPHNHGAHMVDLLIDAKLYTMEGESHLGGLGLANEVLGELMDTWSEN